MITVAFFNNKGGVGKTTLVYHLAWAFADLGVRVLAVALLPSPEPAQLGMVKHYRSMMAMAHEARKPVFHLQAADGAIGSHATAARQAGTDFRELARRIAVRVGFALPRG